MPSYTVPSMNEFVFTQARVMRIEQGQARRAVKLRIRHHLVDIALRDALFWIIIRAEMRFHFVSITWITTPARRIKMSGLVWKSPRSLTSVVRQNSRPPCSDTVRSVPDSVREISRPTYSSKRAFISKSRAVPWPAPPVVV